MNVQPSKLLPIDPEETFRFSCHPDVPCFNLCCRDLNQALTPYDVLRLKNHLSMSTAAFIQAHGILYTGSATGLPVASLRFDADKDRSCPFVTPAGCRVYAARPSSCRTYPVARALRRIRADGSISEHFAIIREPHCRGFEQGETRSVRQWMQDQQLEQYNQMNDMLMELIALKNQLRPGDLSPEHGRMVRTAFYDVETLSKEALSGNLPGMQTLGRHPLPEKSDEEGWLIWGFRWVKQILFGERNQQCS